MPDFILPIDLTGEAVTHRVPEEIHPLPTVYGAEERFIFASAGPFFGDSIEVYWHPSNVKLVRGVDYELGHPFIAAGINLQRRVYSSVVLRDRNITGQVRFAPYQIMGGPWGFDQDKILTMYLNRIFYRPTRSFEEVYEVPITFPLLPHTEDINDLMQLPEFIAVLDRLATVLSARVNDALRDHIDLQNAHGMNAQALGLDLIPNYPQATVDEAINRDVNDRLMTPFLTDLLLRSLLPAALAFIKVTSDINVLPGKRYLVVGNNIHLTFPELLETDEPVSIVVQKTIGSSVFFKLPDNTTTRFKVNGTEDTEVSYDVNRIVVVTSDPITKQWLI